MRRQRFPPPAPACSERERPENRAGNSRSPRQRTRHLRSRTMGGPEDHPKAFGTYSSRSSLSENSPEASQAEKYARAHGCLGFSENECDLGVFEIGRVAEQERV